MTSRVNREVRRWVFLKELSRGELVGPLRLPEPPRCPWCVGIQPGGDYAPARSASALRPSTKSFHQSNCLMWKHPRSPRRPRRARGGSNNAAARLQQRLRSFRVKINTNHREAELDRNFIQTEMSKCGLTVFLLSDFSLSPSLSLSLSPLKFIHLHSTAFWCFSPPRGIWACLFQPRLFIAPLRLLLLPRQHDQENGQIIGPRLLGKPGPCEADMLKQCQRNPARTPKTAQNMQIILNVLLQRANGRATPPGFIV